MIAPLNLVIVGAGIGGLTCAIAARRQGLSVTMLERTGSLTAVGAGIQIPPNASRVWDRYGILDAFKPYSVVVGGMQVRRYRDGEVLCTKRIGYEDRLPWIVIHRADYQRVLVEECERLGVNVRLGADVQDVDFENTTVTLGTGEVVSADVIIGADGLWSTLRSHILGHDSPPQETGDLAYRGTFSRTALLALNDPAIDELCEKQHVTVWFGPNSHVVFYPLRAGTEFNLVMACPDDLPAHVRTAKGDLEEMKARFGGWDPVLTKILTAFSSVMKWKMLHHDELTSWSKNNMALLGDACHPSLPYQSQGAAMAVEDGAILGTLLSLFQTSRSQPPSDSESAFQSQLSSTPTIPATLALYEAIQKARTSTMHRGSLANQHLYHMADGAEQEERDAVLRGALWRELAEGESERFIFVDVRYQRRVVGRDAVADAERGWVERFR